MSKKITEAQKLAIEHIRNPKRLGTGTLHVSRIDKAIADRQEGINNITALMDGFCIKCNHLYVDDRHECDGNPMPTPVPMQKGQVAYCGFEDDVQCFGLVICPKCCSDFVEECKEFERDFHCSRCNHVFHHDLDDWYTIVS